MMEKKLDTFEELMLDFLAGKLSEDGERKLLHFLQSDISYQQRYKEMARTRAKSFIGKFEQEKQADYEALSVKLGIKKKSEKKRIPLWSTFSQVAAIALLILTTSIAGYYIYNDVAESNQEMALCQMEVPLGSQTKVILPDGSVVCLNSGSVLKYDPAFLRKKNREVYLIGEGYFEVQKNPEKPFIVHADDINVKVLGTVFNVRSYPEDSEIEVSLIKGKVNVFSTSETRDNVILAPDEQLTYDKRSGKMNHHHVDALQTSQWTTGRLSFVNASVPEIMKAIERKYDVRIVIHSKYLDKEVFSGSISPKLTVEEILDYMDVDNKYSWSRSGNVITITDKSIK
ncbi:FecR family protein [Bacteroides fragilis]|uniref:FecR family protein n=1 Tax=Bacteroides fragilis TaxID=817 RepID=UPI001CE10E9D|nr:FecR family protein [Bacteroides fragilis]MCA5613151.1 FecR family protein [Bacteroides fragilis]MDY4458326.1 FecR family protein [Bacteroides fragilis]